MKILYKAKVRLVIREFGGDLGGFLDMLRYDGCRVRAWDSIHEGARSVWSVTLVNDRPFTEARWESFGLRLTDLTTERVS